MNHSLKTFLIIIGIIAGVFLTIVLGLVLITHFTFAKIFDGPFYSKKDLIENFEKRTPEIIEVKDYYKSILPEGASTMIEFDSKRELGIFHVRVDSVYQSNWNLKINSFRVDSLLNELNWTKQELYTLKEKLEKANCISIGGREPVSIGWQRSGMGKYFYNIFEQNLNEEQIADNNDGCNYIFYKDNIVLEYGGGAIGPQCFPGYISNKQD